MAGLSLSLVLVVAAVAWVATGSDDPYVAPVPGSGVGQVDPAAAAAALADLVRAVEERDPDAARALAARRRRRRA